MGYIQRPARDIDILSAKAREQGLPPVDELVGSIEAQSLRSEAFQRTELVIAAHAEASPSLSERIGRRILQMVGLRR